MTDEYLSRREHKTGSHYCWSGIDLERKKGNLSARETLRCSDCRPTRKKFLRDEGPRRDRSTGSVEKWRSETSRLTFTSPVNIKGWLTQPSWTASKFKCFRTRLNEGPNVTSTSSRPTHGPKERFVPEPIHSDHGSFWFRGLRGWGWMFSTLLNTFHGMKTTVDLGQVYSHL